MVEVYITNVVNLPDPLERPEIMKGLSEDRIFKIRKYKQLKDRKQSLGAGLLLLKVLEEKGKSVDEIKYSEHGKPELEGIHFNLSHSQDMAVCAVSEAPVGIDIEKIEKVRGNVAARYFTPKENAYLDQFHEEEREREFFRLWTMKESYIKMTGEGMKLRLDRIEFDLTDEVKVYRDGKPCDCHIKEYEIPEYKLALCGMESDFVKEVRVISLP